MKLKSKLIDIGVEKASKKMNLTGTQQTLAKLYLKSPSKIQLAIAKSGVKRAVNKKKKDLIEMLSK